MGENPGTGSRSEDAADSIESEGTGAKPSTDRSTDRFVPRSPFSNTPNRGTDDGATSSSLPSNEGTDSLGTSGGGTSTPTDASDSTDTTPLPHTDTASHWMDQFRAASSSNAGEPEQHASSTDNEPTASPRMESAEDPAEFIETKSEVPADPAAHTDESSTFAASSARSDSPRDDTARSTDAIPDENESALGPKRDKPRRRMPKVSAPRGLNTAHLMDRLRGLVDPTQRIVSTVPHMLAIGVGLVLILFELLANSAGSALIVASAIVPILVLLTLLQHDVFEHEPPLIILGIVGVGAAAGLIIGGLSAWLSSSNWFDEGILNYGAAGFGGRFADSAGSAPFFVWFLNGIVLPLAALAAMVAGPIALRRYPQFRNEIMDGVILTGAGAAGFAIGTAIIFWGPTYANGGPSTDVSDWTLMILGMGVFRPITLALCGAMLGAGVWRYMLTAKTSVLILPGIGSVGGMILLSLGSILTQPAGLWPEIIWTVLVMIAVFVLYRLVLEAAIRDDSKSLGDDGAKIVCPHCHKLTLKGAFCSRCGEPLPAEAS